MRSSEWVALLYFIYLAVVCWLRPLPPSRRLIITSVSVVLVAAIWITASVAPSFVRDWAPFLYVSVGYYLTGFLFVAPSLALEAWLLKWDHRWLGDPTTRFAKWPWWVVAYLDVVYTLCFLLLPGGFAALALTGHSDRANRYWTMVLAADLGAFAPLSVFQTRPPWALEPAPTLRASGIHRLASVRREEWDDRREHVSERSRGRHDCRRHRGDLDVAGDWSHSAVFGREHCRGVCGRSIPLRGRCPGRGGARRGRLCRRCDLGRQLIRVGFRSILALMFLVLVPGLARAQGQTPPRTGVLQGTVTTQSTVRLPGAEVVVSDAAGKKVSSILSDEDGHFSVVGLAPGRYKVSAAVASFVTTTVAAEVTAGRSTDMTIDLPIEGITQSVDVVAASPVVSNENTLAPTETLSGKEIDTFTSGGGGLQATMRLLASVIEAPNGMSIRGGRPNQAGVQLGVNTMVDPSTGLSKILLPDDAIESVSVLPNPYAVEFGRFSSGVVVIQTRRAGDVWRLRINDIDPTFRTHRGSPVEIIGLGREAPRAEFGGPIIKNKLFVQQALQFIYNASDVPSLSEDLLRTSTSFSSFTRVDANLSARHSMVATLGIFPGKTHGDLLGTFMPFDATVDTHVRANEIAVTERAVWTDSLFGETSLHVHNYQTDVMPQGGAPMQLLPDTTLGNFFNQQHRDTATYQVIASVSGSRSGKAGSHLFKAGVDLLRNSYDGTSVNRPVLIERNDGTLARSLIYPVPTEQSSHTTDVALFVQDRFQPNARWYIEFGGRLDRDGVVQQFNLTPRVGSALLLNKSGSAVLREGSVFSTSARRPRPARSACLARCSTSDLPPTA